MFSMSCSGVWANAFQISGWMAFVNRWRRIKKPLIKIFLLYSGVQPRAAANWPKWHWEIWLVHHETEFFPPPLSKHVLWAFFLMDLWNQLELPHSDVLFSGMSLSFSFTLYSEKCAAIGRLNVEPPHTSSKSEFLHSIWSFREIWDGCQTEHSAWVVAVILVTRSSTGSSRENRGVIDIIHKQHV